MALTNNERVGKALDLLSVGLAPFVEREFKAVWGSDWLQYARKDERSVSPTDIHSANGLLNSGRWADPTTPPCFSD
jgi:hypothetical protein